MNEEKLAINILNALGVKDVTTTRQKNNGTTMFELPTGDTVAEFKSGYIRKYLMSKQDKLKFHTCYQLNPQYKTPYKMIWSNGEFYEGTNNRRMMIFNRAERLKRLVLYTIKKINETK
jgi:outer membrane protein assembly factor BamB